MNGEQALFQGAVQAGVRVAAGYPGSPSTAVLTQLLRAAKERGIYAEWSINEKAALELCWGAAASGLRALFCSKGVGLNVALDTLMAVNLLGTRAGLTLLIGDDPSAYKSQNEQDSRALALFAELPALEPTRIQDASAMMRHAFNLSERLELPVLLRETRSFAFTDDGRPAPDLTQKTDAPIPASPVPVDITLDRSERRWIATTSNVVGRRRALHAKLETAVEEFERSPFNRLSLPEGARVGILSAGFAASKLDAVLEHIEYREPIARLDLGTLHPLPANLTARFLERCERVLALEETDPIIETQTKALAHERGISAAVVGRTGSGSGFFPREGELLAPQIAKGVAAFLGVDAPSASALTRFNAPPVSASALVPPVSEGLCEGCPYDPTFRAMRAVLEERGEKGVVLADPGCAVRVMLPPLEMLDVKTAMGACIGIACGIAHSNPHTRVIACPGDSGFFHTGLPAAANAAYNRAPIVILVLDNLTTALSGCQPSPTTGITGMGERVEPLLPEDFASALQIGLTRVFDPNDMEAAKAAFRAAFAHNDLSLLVSRSPCVLV